MLNKILDVTRKITNIIVTFLFMVVVAVVFAQVVARYVAGSWNHLYRHFTADFCSADLSAAAETAVLIVTVHRSAHFGGAVNSDF